MSLNKPVLAIIDIDGLYYHCSKETIQESIEEFDKRFVNILEKTKATHYVAFCSQGSYFRNTVKTSYKGQRQPTKLKWIGTLKAYSKVKYKVRNHQNVEADDLCAYFMKNPMFLIEISDPNSEGYMYPSQSHPEDGDKFIVFEKVLCSPDKDLLQGFEGKHFNYTYKLQDKEDLNSLVEGWFVETSSNYASKFFWKQMLMGDSADNILGCGKKVVKEYKTGKKKGLSYEAREGIGPKAADRIIQESSGIENYEKIVLDEYIKMFGIKDGAREFCENYDLLKLLTTDGEFLKHSNGIPSLSLNKVIDDKEEKGNQDDVPEFE